MIERTCSPSASMLTMTDDWSRRRRRALALAPVSWHEVAVARTGLPFKHYYALDPSENPTVRPAEVPFLPPLERVPGEDGLVVVAKSVPGELGLVIVARKTI